MRYVHIHHSSKCAYFFKFYMNYTYIYFVVCIMYVYILYVYIYIFIFIYIYIHANFKRCWTSTSLVFSWAPKLPLPAFPDLFLPRKVGGSRGWCTRDFSRHCLPLRQWASPMIGPPIVNKPPGRRWRCAVHGKFGWKKMGGGSTWNVKKKSFCSKRKDKL